MKELKEDLKSVLTNKTVLLVIVLIAITSSISFLLGKNAKVINIESNKDIIEQIRIQNNQAQHKMDSVVLKLDSIQLEQRLLNSNIKSSLNNLNKLESQRNVKINNIRNKPIDSTVLYLSNRYN